ncbi:hypothetical protein [Tomitella gaofuii]|uniref:hypothetical protein n=1 Tax=Tomitella gaofuii TaxID=2760083 RepID=UPI0015F7AA15|nr:hypothetical protein [Tomitella gaofuii]
MSDTNLCNLIEDEVEDGITNDDDSGFIAAEVLASIRRAGYAVVKLPEPKYDDMGRTIFPVDGTPFRDGEVVVSERRGAQSVGSLGVPNPIDRPEVVAGYAAALMAAYVGRKAGA